MQNTQDSGYWALHVKVIVLYLIFKGRVRWTNTEELAHDLLKAACLICAERIKWIPSEEIVPVFFFLLNDSMFKLGKL